MAPPGSGRTIEPVIVATKMARRRHELGAIPSGVGITSTKSPDRRTMPHLTSWLPSFARVSDGSSLADLVTSGAEGTSSSIHSPSGNCMRLEKLGDTIMLQLVTQGSSV